MKHKDAQEGDAAVSLDAVNCAVHGEHPRYALQAHPRRERKVGRPSLASEYTKEVLRWLQENPALTTQELFVRATAAGYSGRKTAFYALVAGVRANLAPPSGPLDVYPGELSRHGIASAVLSASHERVYFLVSRLEYSQAVRVTWMHEPHVETLLRALADHFVQFGGLPRLALFDSTKYFAKRVNGDSRSHDYTFALAMFDLGVSVDTLDRFARDSVERLSDWFARGFLASGHFRDAADLDLQLRSWLCEINERPASAGAGQPPEARRQHEIKRLRSIKTRPEQLAVRLPVEINSSSELIFKGVPYALSPSTAASFGAATLIAHHDRLEIVGEHVTFEYRRRD